ncbi:hypothetical protein [Lyngbya sp. CCY1209]|uniref:hypothetical protein n=1 Tax=Lyngbya sp. CCY1209 TaxID=2886103 RepID=UPI002D20143F|nr:hypothetical protein [Lyngbya sp. CCY1209]MEB3883009.1 hypothetical protein [Lyngbya sp. CCY1209]
MKKIAVMLGLVASTSCGLLLSADFGAVESAQSSSLNRVRNESSIVAQTGYEGRNEDGESETVDTSS